MSQEALESQDPNGYNIFFNENKSGNFKPRAVLVDTEPLACESVLKGKYGQLYNRDQFLMGKEEACHFFRGEYTLGGDLIDEMLEKVRLQMEQEDYC